MHIKRNIHLPGYYDLYEKNRDLNRSNQWMIMVIFGYSNKYLPKVIMKDKGMIVLNDEII
jgi:hypothetical protein